MGCNVSFTLAPCVSVSTTSCSRRRYVNGISLYHIALNLVFLHYCEMWKINFRNTDLLISVPIPNGFHVSFFLPPFFLTLKGVLSLFIYFSGLS